MGFDIPTLQLITYSALTCASVIVACVSLLFGFHQNFGWKPIVFPTSIAVMPLPPSHYLLSIEYKVWNRRKYPIIITLQDVEVEKLSYIGTSYLPNEVQDTAPPWQWSGRHFFDDHQVSLGPNEYHNHKITLACIADSIDSVYDEKAVISVSYFDPNKFREKVIKYGKVDWRMIIRTLPGKT